LPLGSGASTYDENKGEIMRRSSVLIALLAVLALGLVAAGCGGDDDETTVPENAQEALDDASQSAQDAIDEANDSAQEALEDAPENIDEAVQQCLDAVDASGIPDDQAQGLKDLCESGGDAAGQALEDLGG
jgi:uncharacterized protein YgiB involved in biofilm formation